MDDKEYELKQLELTLKGREVTAREREVAAKEKEPRVPWWTNPLVIGLTGAALALGGNIVTNILSNSAAAKTEHQRAQSDLIQAVIKTGGNELDTCKNLDFFARIGLLDDAKGAIHNACGTKGEGGIPTLPANALVEQGSVSTGLISPLSQPSFGIATTLNVKVDDATSHEPIANARVDVQTPPPSITISGNFGSSVRSTVTDAAGLTTLSFVSSYDTLTVSKDGYITQTTSLAQAGLITFPAPTVTIDLQRTPAAKK
jgi:hypothetical protein